MGGTVDPLDIRGSLRVRSPTEVSNFNKTLLRATEISIIFQQHSENVKK